MPRDGSHIYQLPFPDVVEGTTIESAVYNGFTNDVAIDLNAPRPIIAGGTGASSADEALTNLSGEKATQLVTNFDSHVWYPGSFRAAAGATGEPVAGHATAGWCYIGEALATPPTNQNVVVHAFDLDALAGTYLLYSRQKKAGVWSNWSITTTEDNQAGARQAIYAAPFDAMAYNGMQINGSMNVSQERGATAVDVPTASATYLIDGWYVGRSNTAGSVIAQQHSGTTPSHAGLFNSVNVYGGVSPPSVGASDYVVLAQKIEGYRWSRLGFGTSTAQSVTIGFWVFSNTAGTMSVALRNVPSNRSYVTTVTLAVNTWQYKTVTIPGDITGTWAIDSTSGVSLTFGISGGSSSTSTLNAWQAGNLFLSTAQTNFMPSVNQGVYISGVVVLPGTEAPSAERSALVMRPYDQELVTCMRYWEKGVLGWNGSTSSGGVMSTTTFYKATKRAGPTITPVNSGSPVGFPTAASIIDSNTPGVLSGFLAYRVATATGPGSFSDTWTADARL